MKKTKLEKGITLVALIITIVVLLILAVVSIGAVKNSGIIGHATNTSDAWKEEQNNEASYLQGYEDMIVESTKGKKVTYTEEGVPVPLEFEVVEGTKDTGLVIKHKTEGSEFVWIPVENGTLPDVTGSEPAVVTGNGTEYDAVSTNLEKAGMPAGSIKNDFSTQLTKEYEAMKASVAKYKGFYVGRYETSMNAEGTKAQSKSGETPLNSVDWYTMYKNSKTYSTSGVISEMIWGSQWNEMMTFIGDKASLKGNIAHGSSNFNTMPYKTGGTDYSTSYNKQVGETGYVAYNDICKNIYDLEGNVSEWTQEAFNTSERVIRGGSYRDNILPINRINGSPAYSDSYLGSRLTLYIEL